MFRIASLLAILALAAPAAADSHEAAAPGASSSQERMAPEPRPAEPSPPPEAAPDVAPAEAAPAGRAEAGPAGSEPAAAPAVEVARAQFTTAMEGREPTDRVERLDTRRREVFFFSELRGFQGRRVLHRWRHEGEVRAEVPFDVRGPRWRVYSSKALLPGWTGEWTVSVVTGDGDVVAEESFVYAEASPEPAAARAPAAEGGAPEAAPDASEPAGTAPRASEAPER